MAQRDQGLNAAIDTVKSSGHNIGSVMLSSDGEIYIMVDGVPRSTQDVYKMAEQIEERQ